MCSAQDQDRGVSARAVIRGGGGEIRLRAKEVWDAKVVCSRCAVCSDHGPARRVVAFMKINTPQLALVSIVHGRLRTIAHLETTTITKCRENSSITNHSDGLSILLHSCSRTTLMALRFFNSLNVITPPKPLNIFIIMMMH